CGANIWPSASVLVLLATGGLRAPPPSPWAHPHNRQRPFSRRSADRADGIGRDDSTATVETVLRRPGTGRRGQPEERSMHALLVRKLIFTTLTLSATAAAAAGIGHSVSSSASTAGATAYDEPALTV